MNRWLCLACLVFLLQAEWCGAGVAPPRSITGPKTLLIIAVRFKDAAPGVALEDVMAKAGKVGQYVRAASYGKVSLEPRLAGWYQLPGSLADYRVSPYNYKVDKGRVRKLLARALGAARADGVDPAAHDLVWVLVGARTEPGKGYGMIAYCANPGMLSMSLLGNMRLEEIELAGGGTYQGPVVVSAENSHVGHVAHDLLHALGGAEGGDRVVPDLYDFQLQSNPPAGAPMLPEVFAIHAGPWGIMSQHFIDKQSPPPHPLAFTRIQLGWIEPGQVVDALPGEERRVVLAPLSGGTGTLAVRIRLGDKRFVLLENRQPLGKDAILPGHGLIVSRVDETLAEGGGIVKVVDAVPETKTLYDAAFTPGGGPRGAFVDKRAGLAVLVRSLGPDGSLDILLTTPDKLAAVP